MGREGQHLPAEDGRARRRVSRQRLAAGAVARRSLCAGVARAAPRRFSRAPAHGRGREAPTARPVRSPGSSTAFSASTGGRSCCWVERSMSVRGCYAWNLDGGSPRPISAEGSYEGLAVSPDGQWVATGGERLILHPVAGGEARVVPGASGGVVRQWSADGRWLFVRRPSPDTLLIPVDLVDVRHGRAPTLEGARPPERAGVWQMGGVKPTPDGTGYVYNYRLGARRALLGRGPALAGCLPVSPGAAADHPGRDLEARGWIFARPSVWSASWIRIAST